MISKILKKTIKPLEAPLTQILNFGMIWALCIGFGIIIQSPNSGFWMGIAVSTFWAILLMIPDQSTVFHKEEELTDLQKETVRLIEEALSKQSYTQRNGKLLPIWINLSNGVEIVYDDFFKTLYSGELTRLHNLTSKTAIQTIKRHIRGQDLKQHFEAERLEMEKATEVTKKFEKAARARSIQSSLKAIK